MKKTVLLNIILFLHLLAFHSSSLGQSYISNSESDHLSYLHQACDSLIKLEEFDQAITLKKEELILLSKTIDHDHMAYCSEKLALLYYHTGDYHMSLRLYERTFDYYDQQKDFVHMSTNRVNSANVYTRLGKNSEAIKYLFEAEKLYLTDSAKYCNQLVGLYTNIGLAYYDLPNLDSSTYFYKKALDYNKIVKNDIYTAIITNNQGDVFLADNNLEAAFDHFSQALEMAQKLNFQQLIATARLNLGRLELKKENPEEAIPSLILALQDFEKIHALFFIAETHLELSNAYELIGDDLKSLKYYKSYHILNDSIRGSETISRISDLEKEVVVQEESRKRELIQKEKELGEAQNKLQRTSFLLIGGFLVLGLILAFLIIRTLKISLEKNKLKAIHLDQKRELLQNRLDYKKREIENFSTYILEKNSILNDVQDSLSKVSNSFPESKSIQDALSAVNHNLRIDQDRKKLDLKIDQAHQEFIDRLTNSYPKLSATEQRLCSLLLMKLGTKDIATIMNIEPDSVKKSKNRIRKKFELEAGADIVEFLKSI